MNITRILALTAAAALALAAGCKRAEQKEASAPKGTETTTAPTDNPTTDPHGGAATKPADPHGGAATKPANPHGAMNQPDVAAGKTADDGTKVIGPFSIKVPEKWLETPPSSGMRMAQFTVNGDAGPAELVVYYFRGGGGSIDANLTRWYGQFQNAKGPITHETADRLDREIGGLKVTTVDVTGKYTAAMSPANPAGPKHNKPDHQMLAAIIQTSAGPFFFKMVGPATTVGAAKGEWDAMVESIEKVK